MAKRILVVEDAQSLRRDIVDMLEFEGYEVADAENGLIALEKVHSFKPNIILLDIMMPVMDGYTVLEKIRNNPSMARTIVIYLTARNEKVDFRQGMELGADDYLTKPFNSSELLKAIEVRVKRVEQIVTNNPFGHISISSTQPEMVKHIFLSYSRADFVIMERVRSDFEKSGISVWTDEELQPGSVAWKNAIQEAIEGAGCLIVVLSPEAKESEWVNRELDYASMHNIRIFPVLARGKITDAIPIELARSQYADIRTEYSGAIITLINSVKEHMKIYG